MVEMKVYLSQSLNEKFRKLAMSVYGYGRGSLSRAAQEAFSKWCAEHEAQSTAPTESINATVEKAPVEKGTSGINPDERPVSTVKSNNDEKDHSSEREKPSK